MFAATFAIWIATTLPISGVWEFRTGIINDRDHGLKFYTRKPFRLCIIGDICTVSQDNETRIVPMHIYKVDNAIHLGLVFDRGSEKITMKGIAIRYKDRLFLAVATTILAKVPTNTNFVSNLDSMLVVLSKK